MQSIEFGKLHNEAGMNDDSKQNDPGVNGDTALALEMRRLAHELNNALMPLMMGTTMLRKKVADPSLERTLTNMETSVRRAAELTNALLTLGRTKAPPAARGGLQD